MAFSNNNPYGLRRPNVAPPPALPGDPQLNEFQKGVRRFVGGVGPAIDRTQAAFQGSLGLREQAEANLAEAQAAEEALNADPRLAPNVARIEDIRTDQGVMPFLEDAGDWAGYSLGANLPLMGSMALTGGGAGLAGRAVLGARAFAPAATAGAAAPYLTQSVAESSQDIMDDGTQGTFEERSLGALTTGAAKTALGMAPLGLAGRVMKAPGLSRLQRGAAAGVMGGLSEGAMEAGEEAIGRYGAQQFNPSVDLTSDEAWSNYLNAFAGGALLGGPTGFAAGVLAPKGLTRSAQHAVQSGVEDGLTPQEALEQYTERHADLLDEGELQALWDDLPAFQAQAPRSPLERRMADLEARDELDMAYSNVLGVSEEDYQRLQANELSQALARRRQAEARRQSAPLDEATGTDALLDILEGRLDPASVEAQRVFEAIGPNKARAKMRALYRQLNSLSEPDDVSPGEAVADYEQAPERGFADDEAEGLSQLASSLDPDAVEETRNYTIEDVGEGQTLYNALGLPWTRDKAKDAASLAERLTLEGMDTEQQAAYRNYANLEGKAAVESMGEAERAKYLTGADLKERSPYRLTVLEDALREEAKQVGIQDIDAYLDGRAQAVLDDHLNAASNEAGEITRNEVFDTYKKYADNPRQMLKDLVVVQRQPMPPAVDPEAMDVIKASRMRAKEDPVGDRAYKAMERKRDAMESKLLKTVFGSTNARSLYEEYSAIENANDRVIFRNDPDNKPTLDRIEKALASDEARAQLAEFRDAEKWLRDQKYRKEGVVRANKRVANAKRIPVRLFHSDPKNRTKYPNGVVRLLDPMAAAQANTTEIPYDTEKGRDVLMRRIVDGIASVIASRSQDYRLEQDSIDPNTIVYSTKDKKGKPQEIRWKDVVLYFTGTEKAARPKALDLTTPREPVQDKRPYKGEPPAGTADRVTTKTKDTEETGQLDLRDRPKYQGTGIEHDTDAKALPADEGEQTSGGLAKDPGPYQWDVERFEPSGLDARIERLRALELVFQDDGSVSAARIGRLTLALEDARKEWGRLNKRLEKRTQELRDKYKAAKTKGKSQQALDEIASNAAQVQQVFAQLMQPIAKQGEALKAQIEKAKQAKPGKAGKRTQSRLADLSAELERLDELAALAQEQRGGDYTDAGARGVERLTRPKGQSTETSVLRKRVVQSGPTLRGKATEVRTTERFTDTAQLAPRNYEKLDKADALGTDAKRGVIEADLVARDDARRRGRHQNVVDEMVKRLGLGRTVTVIDAEQAMQLMRERGGNPATNQGFTTTVKGQRVIYVNPLLTDAAAMETLGHELGHIVLKETWDSASKRLKDAVLDDFNTWVRQFKAGTTVYDVASTRVPSNMLYHMLRNRNLDTPLAAETKERQEYILAFDEWFADNVSRWMVTDAKPVGVVQQFFKHVADLLADLWDGLTRSVNRPESSVARYMDAIFQRDEPLPTFEVQEAVMSFADTPGVAKEEVAAAAQLTSPAWGVPVDRNTIDKALSKALSAEEIRLLGNAVQRNHVRQQLAQFYGGDPTALRVLDSYDTNGNVVLAYLAWRAGKLELSKRQDGAFRKFQGRMAEAMGIVLESKNAEKIMQQIASGQIFMQDHPSYVQSRINETALQQGRKYVENMTRPVLHVLNKFGGTAEMRMRETKNPAIQALWRQFYLAAGVTGGGEGFFSARHRMRGRFEQRLHEIYDGKDTEFGARVVKLLNKEVPLKEASTEEKEAVQRTYGLLQEMYRYAVESGVNLGNLGPEYFPRIYSVEYLEKHNDEFVQMLVDNYAEELKEYGERLQGKGQASGPEVVARRIQRALVTADGEETGAAENMAREESDDPLGWPALDAIKTRELGWIKDSDIAPYLSQDLGLTMSTYINQMVKRAEYNKRFGVGTGRKLVTAYLDEAKKLGASGEELETARNAVKAALGTLGADINPTLHKWQGALLVLENWLLLGMATLTSIADIAGLAVRGDMEVAWQSLKAGVAEVKAAIKGDQTELNRLAGLLGVNELHSTVEALGYEYGGYYVTGTARRWNERLFSVNLLTKWTRLTRTMALAGARSFLEKHGSFDYNKDSERFMLELGLRKGDIKLDKDGKLVILSHAEREKLLEAVSAKEAAGVPEYERDERVRVALNRWVDEAILRPDAAQRPIWASDPHWMLVFHLKAFTYSFHERILRRVGGELMQGNYKPAMALLGYLPLIFVAQALRNGLSGDDMDEIGPQDAGFLGTTHYLAQRAGLYGMGQFYFDITKGWQYGDTPVSVLGGPSLEHLMTVLEAAWTESEADDEYAAWRSAPMGNIFRKHFEE